MKNKQFEHETRIVLLGTGTPNPDPTRSGPAVAVVVNDQAYLFDLGPGVIRRSAEACQLGIPALDNPGLTRAFITHLHSDHTAGMADFLLTPWVLERQDPVHIYGPVGIKHMVRQLLSAYREDIDQRIEGLEKKKPESLDVRVEEIEAGWIYRDDLVSITAFPASHGSWPAYSFQITAPDRNIIISGDTAPNDDLLEAARGCDVLIHEVYSVAGFKKRSHRWQIYHSNVHTSALELADIANKVQPGLLVLYHQLYWGTSDESLLDEIRRDYKGKIHSGKDFDII